MDWRFLIFRKFSIRKYIKIIGKYKGLKIKHKQKMEKYGFLRFYAILITIIS